MDQPSGLWFAVNRAAWISSLLDTEAKATPENGMLDSLSPSDMKALLGDGSGDEGLSGLRKKIEAELKRDA